MCRVADPEPGFATLTLECDGYTTVVNAVPAAICPECGEEYLDEAVVRRVLAAALAGE
ncbi:MAG: YgiT-type zinc finger protein [Anaerolineae bacterium]|nr:MAG: YgiT-type zinc finger protein [Anaerolineae bacterium]